MSTEFSKPLSFTLNLCSYAWTLTVQSWLWSVEVLITVLSSKTFTVLPCELYYTLVRFSDELGVRSGSELCYTPVVHTEL